ncbi:uncharacterized protein TNCV_829181 [Trichonephila clavipes]|nr:uncharacterized protein TNCV_829181 [Trichonephila clavipes]
MNSKKYRNSCPLDEDDLIKFITVYYYKEIDNDEVECEVQLLTADLIRGDLKFAARSSCAMEQEAALKLWQRSEDSGFRYTTLLSDGDAKTYQYLNTKEVYGPEIKIKKEECINHVSKTLGTSLRKAVKEWRARGVSLGGKSRGSLKEETKNCHVTIKIRFARTKVT